MSKVYTFNNVVPMDDTEYPCYRLDLTAEEIYQLIDEGVIDIDPTYQRGKTTPTRTKPSVAVQSQRRNIEHIQSILQDMVTISPLTKRNIALIPPMWANARRPLTSLPMLAYNSVSRQLTFTNIPKLYVVDGWHRCLAIRRAYREHGIKDRKFSFYVTDAPVSMEARAFRLLNSAALPVERTRVAWVSAPYSQDLYQVAYEFVQASPSFVQNGEVNLETIKSTVSRSSKVWCSFLAIANGFTSNQIPNQDIWPGDQLNPADSVTRKMIVNYMVAYWQTIVRKFPDLGFCSVDDRQRARKQLPLLYSNIMAQNLMWLGHRLLQCYQASGSDQSYLAKLKELQNPSNRAHLFLALAPLNVKTFKSDNPIWKTMINAKGSFERNDFKSRKQVYDILVRELNLTTENSLGQQPLKATAPARTLEVTTSV